MEHDRMKRVALKAQAAAVIAMAAPMAALAAPALVAFRRSMAGTVLAARGRLSVPPDTDAGTRTAEALESPDAALPVSTDGAPDTAPRTTTYTAPGQSGRKSKVTLPGFPGDSDQS